MAKDIPILVIAAAGGPGRGARERRLASGRPVREQHTCCMMALAAVLAATTLWWPSRKGTSSTVSRQQYAGRRHL
jgi:hypothetical protein